MKLANVVALVAAVSVQSATTTYEGYSFEAQVTSKGKKIREHSVNGRPTMYVQEGAEYSVELYNPLPVRVGVALSLDGLNSIDGKRTKPAQAAKWIIEPYSSVTVRGWQTGSSKLRRFVFTRQKDTYAQWKQQVDKTDYVRNLGVIGVAWFWSSDELRRALEPPRPYVTQEYEYDDRAMKSRDALAGGASSTHSDEQQAPSRARSAAPSVPAEKKQEKAGTGMGKQERNDVTRVEFTFDTGMYSGSDVLAIYYEFAKKRAQPTPFEDDEDGYAPDMHSDTPERQLPPSFGR